MQGWMIAMGVFIGAGLVADGAVIVACRRMEKKLARLDDDIVDTKITTHGILRVIKGGIK